MHRAFISCCKTQYIRYEGCMLTESEMLERLCLICFVKSYEFANCLSTGRSSATYLDIPWDGSFGTSLCTLSSTSTFF